MPKASARLCWTRRPHQGHHCSRPAMVTTGGGGRAQGRHCYRSTMATRGGGTRAQGGDKDRRGQSCDAGAEEQVGAAALAQRWCRRGGAAPAHLPAGHYLPVQRRLRCEDAADDASRRGDQWRRAGAREAAAAGAGEAVAAGLGRIGIGFVAWALFLSLLARLHVQLLHDAWPNRRKASEASDPTRASNVPIVDSLGEPHGGAAIIPLDAHCMRQGNRKV
jgi:hypothetical protein